MHVEPIRCLRPAPDRAAHFVSLPYDVFTRAEARSYVEAHPTSFLAIDRPETSFSPDHDPYAPDVYQRARDLLDERVSDGTLVRDDEPCYYVIRMEQDGHRQTGIAGGIAVEDYETGVVARHEVTLAAKEADRISHIRATDAQTGPIFCAYRDQPALDGLMAHAMEGLPLYDFFDEQGLRHVVWRVSAHGDVVAMRDAFARLPRAYIADGHHRAASAVRVCQERREAARAAGRSSSEAARADAPWNHFLAMLFPASQLRVLPYNRVVADDGGLEPAELDAALAATGLTAGPPQASPARPRARGEMGLYHEGAWRALRRRDPSLTGDDPVESLDVSFLQSHVLEPVFGIANPREDPRLSFVGGSAETGELERRAGARGVAFLMHETGIDELMAVSDAGRLMPPKSTWFEPKLRSGLLIRSLTR